MSEVPLYRTLLGRSEHTQHATQLKAQGPSPGPVTRVKKKKKTRDVRERKGVYLKRNIVHGCEAEGIQVGDAGKVDHGRRATHPDEGVRRAPA